MTREEVGQFVEAIVGAEESWDSVPVHRLRFRALVEVLLGTGARISEILKLDRRDVSFEYREAKVVGKGNKERTLFFTERSLEWLGGYLRRRSDEETPLFVDHRDVPRRVTYDAVKTCPIGHIKALLGHERLATTCRYYLGAPPHMAAKCASSARQ